jgi:hypothetical protein
VTDFVVHGIYGSCEHDKNPACELNRMRDHGREGLNSEYGCICRSKVVINDAWDYILSEAQKLEKAKVEAELNVLTRNPDFVDILGMTSI